MNIKVLAAVLESANSVRRGSMFDPFWDIKRHILNRFGKHDGFVYQLFPRTCQIVKHRSYVLEGRQFLVPATSLDLRLEDLPDGARCFKGLVKKPAHMKWIVCQSALELVFAPWLFHRGTDASNQAVRLAAAIGPVPSVYLMMKPQSTVTFGTDEVPF